MTGRGCPAGRGWGRRGSRTARPAAQCAGPWTPPRSPVSRDRRPSRCCPAATRLTGVTWPSWECRSTAVCPIVPVPVSGLAPSGRQQVADAGDIACNPFDIGEAVAQIEAGAGALLRDAGHLLAIGGDHTIAFPLLRVTRQRFGPVALVHFDAHLDTWDTYFGAPVTHGTPFRRAAEIGRASCR